MHTALVIGGTRFIGRHLVSELLAHDYDVTIVTRGNRENPFESADAVTHVEGDRTNDSALEHAASVADPDVVFDCIAYFPRDVRAATSIVADVDAYVYVSSAAAYAEDRIPKREDETELESCTTEQAGDDAWSTYGNRKAAGDRAVFAAAADGVRAMAVRPPIVYGPHDHTDRLAFWIDRVNRFDRLLLPGDGTTLNHLAYVEDVAAALRIVAEDGTAGEAYNVGDRRLLTLGEWVGTIADAVGTDVDVVHAGPRELAVGDLEPGDYPLYRSYPHVLSTAKLAGLGWESTPYEAAIERTVAEHLENDRNGSPDDPERAAEERVLGILDTM